MDASEKPSGWTPEALAFLSLLEPMALAEGFLKQDRFANVDPSWCALRTVAGPTGHCLLFLWTTPGLASADPQQAQLWVVRVGKSGEARLDTDRVATYRYAGVEEIAEHVTFVRTAIELASTREAFDMAMRVACDGEQRTQRVEFLARLRGNAVAGKDLPS